MRVRKLIKMPKVFLAAVITSLMMVPAVSAMAEDEKIYTLEAKLIDGDEMPGVYTVKAVKGDSMEAGATIGIPSIAKQNLVNGATNEIPAIIMGAAVNYEIKTGPVEYTPKVAGTDRIAPYSYFRYGIIDEQLQNEDGTVTTHKKLSGFDASYYIIRVDVSSIIEGCGEGQYLHVKQENNKALMVAVGMTDNSYCNLTGTKTASYPLADNFAALKDTGANDKDKESTFLDIILLSSGKLAAGADAGKTDAMSADVKLSFYVDEKNTYNDLQPLDPTNPPTFPYTVGGVTYKLESDYTNALIAKFYDPEKAVNKKNDTSYLVKGSDLEIDAAVDTGSDGTMRTGGIDYLSEKMDYWSMEKAMANQKYDSHTIILICEVPVLDGLVIESTEDKLRYVVLDVNSFDIQIANNTTTGAGLVIGNGAVLRLMDGTNTSGAELAIGNNATMLIKAGGIMIIDQTCTVEVEYDAATSVEPAKADTAILNGVVTIEESGALSNFGVVNIEGTEGKPQQMNPSESQQGQQVYYDKKSAALMLSKGAEFYNFGCVSVKGSLYILGKLYNYGRYYDTLTAYDPDKGTTDYHRGIQITWKDVVTDEGVEPGAVYVGIDSEGKTVEGASIENYGDIVLAPGTLKNSGSITNMKRFPDNYIGRIYVCDADEAVIPITPTAEAPLVTEKRVKVDPAKKSVFANDGTFDNSVGFLLKAKTEVVRNGVLGKISILEIPFIDVPVKSWYAPYVISMLERNIMTGNTNTVFGPDDELTRAMAVTILYRMAGSPVVNSHASFPDVKDGKWYSDAVAWAQDAGIVKGYSKGEKAGYFGTDDAVSRQDFALMLRRYASFKKLDISNGDAAAYNALSDAKDVAMHAREGVMWAFGHKIMGVGSALKPQDSIIRAEAAAMIERFFVNVTEAKLLQLGHAEKG